MHFMYPYNRKIFKIFVNVNFSLNVETAVDSSYVSVCMFVCLKDPPTTDSQNYMGPNKYSAKQHQTKH